ncbi:hypothetical protein SIN8267_01112 [Sinobacterium norvegicum]|uniref:SnoaL-like domain-containing protein n=1 Tax=Sinobacterium norvegicum TaxID=1641715 RepID=A0ABN8EF28_9GAMM|nr:nuclear transport factor 2 family protein [Sinobacterium norvegicum]CAH0991011.1 hypothetical protein SIN8267_01112 [Sinobacterium norvegicum]
MSTNTLESLIAKQDITELIYNYMRGLDRWDKALLQSVFFDDAWCEYGFINTSATKFVDFALAALKTHQANQHMVGNILIDIEGDEAFAEVYFRAYHKVEVDGVFQDIIIAGRYLDRYEKRSGVWKMAYRSELVDWSRTEPTNDPYFEQAPDSLFGARNDDAVYDRDARRKKT